MVRRTKEEAQETRHLLLDAAEHVFNEKGVSRTSLSEIAQAAGVTRGAIYWHFKNKSDLFDAMMERVTLPLENMVQKSGDAALEDPMFHLRATAVNVLKRTATDAQMRRVFDIVCHKCEYVDDMLPLKERHLKSRAQCLAQVELGIKNAIKRGHLPARTNARRAAIGMHALIDGLIANWLLDPEYFDLAREAGHMIDIYLNGLDAKPTGLAAPKRKLRKVSTPP